jgi:thiol-disulfide isomerase/thioredoxin
MLVIRRKCSTTSSIRRHDVGKILACCALCLALVAGWQHTAIQAEGTVLCIVPGQTTLEEELRVKYPKLFKANVVVSFGADWCKWCPAQKAHLRALKARGYQVAYFDLDDHPELFGFFGGEIEATPLTVVLVQGKVKKSFEGLTYWRHIARYARECKMRRDIDIDIKIRI